MGNIQPGSILTRTTGALDSFVSELGTDIIHERSLGSSRFLKTVKCRHGNGHLVIKIFIKPDPSISLSTYVRHLKMEREQLVEIPNVYNYQTFVETEKAGYIIRQWIASNLYDRISTRPFLSIIEKKWIAFQIINALRDTRNRKVAHGDIKSENILVTTWNWVYLSDFASYKPTYLPLDDPSDYSYYFDASGRRTCYLAPERFYVSNDTSSFGAKKLRYPLTMNEPRREGEVTEAMDCFSAGCVIAELFLEGAPMFTLSQLFKYRDGDFNIDAQLSSIEDEGIRNMIKQMISLDPNIRPTFDGLLQSSQGTVFPDSFYSFLHTYVSSVNDLPPNAAPPATVAPSISGPNIRVATSPLNPQHDPTSLNTDLGNPNSTIPSNSDHRIERIWADYASIEPYLIPDNNSGGEQGRMDVKIEYGRPPLSSKPFQDILPIELHIPNRDSKLLAVNHLASSWVARQDGPALIILALITANVRNCSLPSSKLRALDVFLALSSHLTDEAKLDRMIPYIVDLLHDDSPIVRGGALKTLMQVLILVKVITPSNAAIFPEYIIPNIRHLVTDPEVSVRATYAQCITQLADTAVRYLEMGQALKAHGAFKLSTEVQDADSHDEVSYEVSLQDLQTHIQEHLSTLLVDSSSVVRRAVLHDISSLCIFLGRQRTNDVLLSHMITYLNDRDWLLRYAFFESIVDVAACAGGKSLEEYILPLMVQALSDVEENVVAKVLAALISLCELGLFQKMRIWELMRATLGFLYHPNVWIRQGTVGFIASAAKQLPTTDVWCILYPSLRHFLRSDIVSIDEQSLLAALKPPLSRQVLDGAVQWAMKAEKSAFWRPYRREVKTESPKESVISIRKTGNALSKNRSEEDEVYISRLQQLGMTQGDESKLVAMREYVRKLAGATSSFASRIVQESGPEKNLKVITDLELQKLGVVPQTIFLKNRLNDAAPTTSPRSNRLSSLNSNVTAISAKSPITSRSPPGGNRVSSLDPINQTGQPFEDLRRRLVSLNNNGSALSLNAVASPGTHTNKFGEYAAMNLQNSLDSEAAATVTASIIERPASPTDSVVSTTNSLSSAFRPLSRMQVGTGSDAGNQPHNAYTHQSATATGQAQKAAPLIGSSKAMAAGLLDAHFTGMGGMARGMMSPQGTSGRSSPVSVSLRNYAGGAGRTTSGTAGREVQRPPSIVFPVSTYDGQEPGISNLLENLYLDNNAGLQLDFGPRVHEGPVRRRNLVRHSYISRENAPGSSSPAPGTSSTISGNRRTDITLITHLTSHTNCITGISVSPDHTFFVTASDDQTLRVWDTARLERNVTSKPRCVYAQHHAKVKCVIMLEGVHCWASAAVDGSLHVVRVVVTFGNMGVGAGGGTAGTSGSGSGAGGSNVLPKYHKLQVVREHRCDNPGEWITCMVHYNTESASNLIYATTHSNITTLDLRTMRVLQTLENPRHYGPITAICVDKKRAWIIVGTSTGVLTLWDRRFGLLLKSWCVNAANGAASSTPSSGSASPGAGAGVGGLGTGRLSPTMGAAGMPGGIGGRSCKIHQVVVHPSKGKGKWIIVAAETHSLPSAPNRSAHGTHTPEPGQQNQQAQVSVTTLIEVWDIEKSAMVESFVTCVGGSGSATALDQLKNPSPPIPKVQEVQGIEAEPSPAAAIAALVRSRQVGNVGSSSGIGIPLDRIGNTSGQGSSSNPYNTNNYGTDTIRPRANQRNAPNNQNQPTSNSPPSTRDEGLSSMISAPDVRSLVVGLDFGGYTSAAQRANNDLNEIPYDPKVSSSIRTAGRGFMITGSEDRKMRIWDIGRPERSVVLSGLEMESEKPVYSVQSTDKASMVIEDWSTAGGSSANKPTQRMSLITHTQQNLLKSHQDVISALACFDAPFRGGIVSGDRAGVIKVWRVDFMDSNAGQV